MDLTNYDLNKKQIKFFEKYIQTYNATKSYMEAYRVKNEASAAVCSHRLLSRFKDIKKALYEEAGLGIMTSIQILKDALKAEKRVFYNGKVHVYPDWHVRLKALGIIYKTAYKSRFK